MNRKELPKRRQNVSREIEFKGRKYTLCMGYHDDGTCGEIFIDGSKCGSEADYMADDAAIALSLLLQLGVNPSELPGKFSTAPDFINGKKVEVFASIIGVSAQACAEIHEGVNSLLKARNGQ